MKIVVISYNELNNQPSLEQVVSDLCHIFKTSDEFEKENMGSKLRHELSDIISGNIQPGIVFIDTTSQYSRNRLQINVDNERPDLLISYNLAGFELCTLTDSLQYNLYDYRQFHIIQKKDLPNKKYLSKIRSINLFLFENYNS